MTREQVIERGLERIARGDFRHMHPWHVESYAGWLLRQTGNNDEPTPPDGTCACGLPLLISRKYCTGGHRQSRLLAASGNDTGRVSA